MTTFLIWLAATVQMIAGGAYNLNSPDKVYKLPPSFHEISGITAIDASTIACVQDEHGLVFIYDLDKNSIIRQIPFGGDGDYEGVARVNKAIYILRSDEVLIELGDYTSSGSPVVNVYETRIPGKDAEGLCYDPKNNRLLVAPKEISSDNPAAQSTRHIYGFNLASKTLIKGSLIDFDIKEIEEYALKNNIKVPMKGKKGEKKVPDINMKISAIGIHPASYKLYAISGPERLLFVFDMKGNLESLARLDKDIFPQPEGITFMPNGDMLISNEGAKGIPTIVRFSYRQR